jgi:hypothetical protein
MRLVLALRKLYSLGRAEVFISGVATCVMTIVGISSLSANMPAPEFYLKDTTAGKLEREPPKDPKTEVKFRNSGCNPLVIKDFVITTSDGKIHQSFASALDFEETSNFDTSECTSFLMNGSCRSYQGSTFKQNSCITLCTVRPKKLTEDWDKDLRDHISKKGISVKLYYGYFALPYLGPMIKQTKTVTLR